MLKKARILMGPNSSTFLRAMDKTVIRMEELSRIGGWGGKRVGEKGRKKERKENKKQATRKLNPKN